MPLMIAGIWTRSLEVPFNPVHAVSGIKSMAPEVRGQTRGELVPGTEKSALRNAEEEETSRQDFDFFLLKQDPLQQNRKD